MPVLLHSFEKLSDCCGHDRNGSDFASFSYLKTISSDSIYRYWFGATIVEREIYKSLFSAAIIPAAHGGRTC